MGLWSHFKYQQKEIIINQVSTELGYDSLIIKNQQNWVMVPLTIKYQQNGVMVPLIIKYQQNGVMVPLIIKYQQKGLWSH